MGAYVPLQMSLLKLLGAYQSTALMKTASVIARRKAAPVCAVDRQRKSYQMACHARPNSLLSISRDDTACQLEVMLATVSESWLCLYYRSIAFH